MRLQLHILKLKLGAPISPLGFLPRSSKTSCSVYPEEEGVIVADRTIIADSIQRRKNATLVLAL